MKDPDNTKEPRVEAPSDEIERITTAPESGFMAVFNMIPDMLFVLDAEGRIVHVNQVVIDRLGYTLPELIGQSVVCVNPESRREEAARILSSMIAGDVDVCKVPVITRSGEEIPVETRFSKAEMNGQPAFLGVTKDVSQLRLSETKFSLAFHASSVPTAIATVDEGVFLEVNDAFLRLHGSSRHEVIGKSAQELNIYVHQDDRQALRNEIMKRGRCQEKEIQVYDRNGTIHTGIVSADPLTIDGVKCWLATFVDMTERKRIEEKLREAREELESRVQQRTADLTEACARLEVEAAERRRTEEALLRSEEAARAILDATTESVLLIDLEGTILAANSCAARRLGHKVEDIIGRDVYDLFPAEVRKVRKPFAEQVASTGKPVVFKDQRLGRWIHSSVYPVMNDAGRVTRLAIFGEDITERRKTEEQFRQHSALLASIRQAQNLFISGEDPAEVFHELLKVLIAITDSEYGFLDEVLYRESGEAYRSSLALSDLSWDEDSRKLRQMLVSRSRDFANLDSPAGRPTPDKTVIIANNPGRHPHSRGITKGHPLINSYMGIPLFFASTLVGVAGVANRPEGYSRGMASSLETLTSTIASIIWAVRKARNEQITMQALRESEERFRSLIEEAPEAIFVKAGGRFVYVNPAILHLLGASKSEELLGKDFMARVAPEYHEAVRARIQLQLKTGKAVPLVEQEYVRVDGSRVPVEVRAVPIAFKGLDAHLVFLRDITERKRIEYSLRLSEKRFRSLFETSRDSIVLVNQKTGQIIDVNPAACRLYGYSPDEFRALKNTDMSAEPDRTEAAVHESVSDVPFRLHRKKDGTIFPVEISGGYFTEGALHLHTAFIRDITERNMAEETLRESQALLQAILEGSPDPVFVKDRHSRILFGNSALFRLWNKPPEEVIGRDDGELYDDRTIADAIMENDRAVLASESSLAIEELMQTSHGLRTYLSTKTPYKTSNGEIIGIMGIARDITERKQMEAEILQSREELRSLADHISTVREDEKAKIARELHDELGQSLTALLLDLRWLRKKLRKDQGVLAERVDALMAITNGTIETIKRIQGELRPWMLDNLGLCAAMEWQAKKFSEHTRIPVVFDSGNEITVDQKIAVAIFRIFQEALSNVARHAEATEIVVELVQDDNQVSLTVSDNGRGIEQDELQKPLSFGLLGMKERVEAFSGSLTIQGTPGKGTRLHVQIPRVTQSD